MEKMRPYLKRLKHVYGHQVNFSKLRQNVSNCMAKNRNIAISYWIQKWFAASEPDFYAISKMVHYISVPQKLTVIKQNVNFNPFYTGFPK